MRNIRLVARQEFLKNVRKKSFLFAVFGMPLIILGIMVIAIAAQVLAFGEGLEVNTLGFVDDADIIVESVAVPSQWISYSDKDTARAALDNGEIDAYFVITGGYRLTGTVSIYAYGVTPDTLQDDINNFLINNLTAEIETDAPPERLHDPVTFRLFLENTGRELSRAGIIGLFVIPIIFAVVLLMGLQFSAMYLMSGVTEEKTNHIMEILITSITPSQLLTGKLLGLGLLGLMQVLIWLLIGAVIMAVGGNNEFLSSVDFQPDVIALALLYFVLTYFMYASVLAGVGAVVGSEQESRQYASWLMFPIAMPFFFFSLLLFNPDSPVFVALMLIPFTSAMTLLLRLPFTNIPTWQIALSLSSLVISTTFMMWASAKVFRWGLLLQGNKISFRTLWRVLRGSPDAGIVPLQNQEKQA
ncbi:MAG: ABC transporter permease [Anaerolineae bacterium]|nr:ABC transporter permease [Anaerolineae bacterium]